jgi:hypothetical protein
VANESRRTGSAPLKVHWQRQNHEILNPASWCESIGYSKPDSKLVFAGLSSVVLKMDLRTYEDRKTATARRTPMSS